MYHLLIVLVYLEEVCTKIISSQHSITNYFKANQKKFFTLTLVWLKKKNFG